MGGGGPSQSQSGSGWSKAWTEPITWETLLPPWVKAGQRKLLPMLEERVKEGGLTPDEERLLWGMARSEVAQAGTSARKALAGRMAASGISPTSPVWAGELADIEAQVPAGIASAVANMAKLKIGAKDTATKNLLTALYTPPPYATAHFAESEQQSSGSAGGGGK